MSSEQLGEIKPVRILSARTGPKGTVFRVIADDKKEFSILDEVIAEVCPRLGFRFLNRKVRKKYTKKK